MSSDNDKKAINIIVATSTNYGIGYDNKMCWHIPEELKHFKKITTTVEDKKKRNCVIMGKNTWYSLPKRPLPDRINIIISSADYNKISCEVREYDEDNIKVFKNIENAFKYVEENDEIESAFIIGGAQLYNECLDNYVEKIKYMYLTIIYDKNKNNIENIRYLSNKCCQYNISINKIIEDFLILVDHGDYYLRIKYSKLPIKKYEDIKKNEKMKIIEIGSNIEYMLSQTNKSKEPIYIEMLLFKLLY